MSKKGILVALDRQIPLDKNKTMLKNVFTTKISL